MSLAVAENQPCRTENRVHPKYTSRPLTSPERERFVISPLQELQFIAKGVRDLIAAGSRDPALVSDEAFNSVALRLFKAQYAGNLAYRRFCDSRQVSAERTNNWTQIPAVPAAAFKEADMSSLPPEMRTAIFHSSGTTEQRPGRHFHSDDSLVLYEKSLLGQFRAALRDFDFLYEIRRASPVAVLILTPSPTSAPNSSLVHMFAAIRGELGTRDSVFAGRATEQGWELDLEKAIGWLERAEQAGKPVIVFGTAFSFVHLADAFRSSSFKLPPGSVVLETGGYKGRSRILPREELHELIGTVLGVPGTHILCEYGMSELSSQAYGAGRFHFPPWARVQVISPETGREVADGETGLLRVFDLANVYSVMAIQTEDLGIRRGTGFELLGRAQSAEPRGCSLMTISK